MTDDLRARAQRAIEESEAAWKIAGANLAPPHDVTILRGLLTEALEALGVAGHQLAFIDKVDEDSTRTVIALADDNADLRRQLAEAQASRTFWNEAHAEASEHRAKLDAELDAVEADNAALWKVAEAVRDTMRAARKSTHDNSTFWPLLVDLAAQVDNLDAIRNRKEPANG